MSELERKVAKTNVVQVGSVPDVVEGLINFQEVVLDKLASAGLPTEGVLVALSERQSLLQNLEGALQHLPALERTRSSYISKMIIAAAVGLFDAALNYLWDETVNELRNRVIGFDLGYFFDIAVLGDKRRQFETEEDLPRVIDFDLLRACREIGLLSDVGYAQIEHVRYMRNFASAAHPNQVELTGLQLATWLETCIKQVITLPQDTITATTGRLLANLKVDRLDQSEVDATASFFDELPQDRADTLALGLFGLYTDPKRTPVIADNVRLLWPELWDYVSDDARYGFGTRYGRLQANAETSLAAAARELLDLVDGSAYFPEAIRNVEMDVAIDALMTAHRGWDNFSNEIAPARTLATLVGAQGNVPDALDAKFVQTIVTVFLGNGMGVSNGAIPHYSVLLGTLTPGQAGRALRAFTDPAISSLLGTSIGKRQWNRLLDILEPKLTRQSDRTLYDEVRKFTGPLDLLASDTTIAKLAKREVPASRRTRITRG